MIRCELQLEGIEITLLLDHLERTDCVDSNLVYRFVLYSDELQTYGIIEASLVDDVCDDKSEYHAKDCPNVILP